MANTDTETLESVLERRSLLLKDIEPATVRKAWFILSHLLLDEGARIGHMGCGDGAVTYAMAVMAPGMRFVGLDKSKRALTKAKEKFHLHNLEFKIGDASSEVFPAESLDAIINSYVLHEVYSASRYNERIVGDTLRRQFKMLKNGGTMFLQEYAQPPAGEYVLLQMTDEISNGDDPETLCDADLLVWYAQYARPKQDPGCTGFFLEELPPRFPKTRLFRLPHKWAYEFLMRKDDRARFESDISVELTFFTMNEFRRELRMLGSRVQYSAPHWDEESLEKKLGKKITLYHDDGKPMGPPPSCFIVVAIKQAERKSLNIEERRPSGQQTKLKITAMRDQKTGRLLDVAGRGMNTAEIIPYCTDEEGRLKIYLYDGAPKSIVNAVARKGVNIDDRTWSGHMIEAVALPHETMENYHPFDTKTAALFSRDCLSLKPQSGAALEAGPDYYPAPDYIDERIYTFYMKVERTSRSVSPRKIIGEDDRFLAKGVLREFDAQQVLNAIAVGMIPNARLELQILSLFKRLDIPVENWTARAIKLEVGEITGKKSLRKILDTYGMDSKRFREIKGASGDLRALHSTFVEEGQSRGAITGISAQDVDFVIHQEKTSSTAAILPLAKGMKGEVHAAFLMDHTPVPERSEGNGLTASAMMINLPASVTSLSQARQFVAESFSVLPEMVIKMGEPYFTHIGMTPQKIYPFAVAVPPKFMDDPDMTVMPLYQVMMIWQSFSREHKTESSGSKVKFTMDTNLLLTIARSYKMLHDQMKLEAKLELKSIMKERMEFQNPDWMIPMTYAPPPISAPAAHHIPAAPALSKTGLSPEWGTEQAAPAPAAPKQSIGFKAMADSRAVQQPVAQAASAQIQMPSESPSSEMTTIPAAPPSGLSNLISDFEQELQQDIDELVADLSTLEDKPVPQKW
jgi:hypothetical protein